VFRLPSSLSSKHLHNTFLTFSSDLLEIDTSDRNLSFGLQQMSDRRQDSTDTQEDSSLATFPTYSDVLS